MELVLILNEELSWRITIIFRWFQFHITGQFSDSYKCKLCCKISVHAPAVGLIKKFNNLKKEYLPPKLIIFQIYYRFSNTGSIFDGIVEY